MYKKKIILFLMTGRCFFKINSPKSTIAEAEQAQLQRIVDRIAYAHEKLKNEQPDFVKILQENPEFCFHNEEKISKYCNLIREINTISDSLNFVIKFKTFSLSDVMNLQIDLDQKMIEMFNCVKELTCAFHEFC